MEALGIDGKLILAQIFNFVVLLIILKKFLYKPLLNYFSQRQKKIEEGLANSEKIKKELEQIELKKTKIFSEAREENQKFLLEQKKLAQKDKEEIIAQAKIKAQEEVKKGMEQAKMEMLKAKSEVKKEAVGVAEAMVKKMLGSLSAEDQHRIIKKAME